MKKFFIATLLCVALIQFGFGQTQNGSLLGRDLLAMPASILQFEGVKVDSFKLGEHELGPTFYSDPSDKSKTLQGFQIIRNFTLYAPRAVKCEIVAVCTDLGAIRFAILMVGEEPYLLEGKGEIVRNGTILRGRKPAPKAGEKAIISLLIAK